MSDFVRSESLILIDHREDDEEIVNLVAAALGENDALRASWRGDELWISRRGRNYLIPHTISMHDRYVTISSLASILESEFLFFIETESTGSDTHGLLIVEKQQYDQLTEADVQPFLGLFTPLDIGLDYFSGIRVPYTGNPNANPDFARDAKQHKEASDALINTIMGDRSVQQALNEFQQEMRALGVPAPPKRFSWRRFVRNFLVIFFIYFILYFIYRLFR